MFLGDAAFYSRCRTSGEKEMNISAEYLLFLRKKCIRKMKEEFFFL